MREIIEKSVTKIEFLKLYLWNEYKNELNNRFVDGTFIPKNPHLDFRYFSRIGNPLNNTDYVVFFKTEGDMIAYDNWNNIPPPNAQELIDKGRNLYKKIWLK